MSIVTDSGSLAQQLAAAAGTQDGARLATGVVVAVDASGVVAVNLGGVVQAGVLVSSVPMQVGDTVLVSQSGARLRVLALVYDRARPSTGVVASVPADSATIAVTTSLGTIGCGWVTSYTPTVGDTVRVTWLGSEPLVIGKRGVTGSPGTVPDSGGPSTPAPPPSTTTGTTTFTAVSSGTYRTGSGWMSDAITGGRVQQGDYGYGANAGVWFLGGKIHSSLAGVTVTGARVWIGRPAGTGASYGAQAVHMCWGSDDRQPAGAPGLNSSYSWDLTLSAGESGWYPVPASIGQRLVDSGGSLGVLPLNPYTLLYGAPNNGSAGAVQIDWRK